MVSMEAFLTACLTVIVGSGRALVVMLRGPTDDILDCSTTQQHVIFFGRCGHFGLKHLNLLFFFSFPLWLKPELFGFGVSFVV
jgi:hypothetical protein